MTRHRAAELSAGGGGGGCAGSKPRKVRLRAKSSLFKLKRKLVNVLMEKVANLKEHVAKELVSEVAKECR